MRAEACMHHNYRSEPHTHRPPQIVHSESILYCQPWSEVERDAWVEAIKSVVPHLVNESCGGGETIRNPNSASFLLFSFFFSAAPARSKEHTQEEEACCAAAEFAAIARTALGQCTVHPPTSYSHTYPSR